MGELISANARKILRVAANLDYFNDIEIEVNINEQYTVYGLETTAQGHFYGGVAFHRQQVLRLTKQYIMILLTELTETRFVRYSHLRELNM